MSEIAQKPEQEEEKDDSSRFLKKSNWPIFVLLLAVFFSWTAWGLVLQKTSVFSSPRVAIPLFYVAFFFAISTTFALLQTFLKVIFFSFRSLGNSINTAVRQGIILAFVSTIALIFQQFRILTWWDAALLLILGILIELSFTKD